jgi:hypothetical protein
MLRDLFGRATTGGRAMDNRLTRLVLFAVVIVLGIYIAQPYFDRFLYSAYTPRAIEPRGSLSELERSTIELFERDSPSVVQVVGRAGGITSSPSGEEEQRAQTGTGFVWDCHRQSVRARSILDHRHHQRIETSSAH